MDDEADQSLVPGESKSTLCRRCYMRYGDQKSPHCDHIFCASCFDKSVDAATEEFVCFKCKHSTEADIAEKEGTTGTKPDKPCTVDQHEELGTGVKCVNSIRCNRFKEPRRIGVTGAGGFVVVDVATKEILTVSSEGELKKHVPYLIGYNFTGGLLVTQSDDVLLSLKNDKYNSVSFYSAGGTFEFSAFLSRTADVTGIARKESTKEILALDNDKREICVINTDKSIHQHKQLKESREGKLPNISSLSSIAVNTPGDVIVHDSVNRSVLVFDDKYNFRYAFDTIVETECNDTSLPTECSKIAVDHNNCIFTTNSSNNGVVVFSRTGELVTTVVMYSRTAGSVQDFVCFGENKMAVLLTGGSARRGEIRVYSYTIDRRFRNGDNPQCCVIA